MKKWINKLIENVNQKANDDNYTSIWKFLSALLKAIMKELNSIPGKINIISDILLLVMFICILISTSINTLFIFIQNIFAMFTDKNISSLDFNILVVCFIIFALFCICCLIFMHVIIKNENKLEDVLLENRDNK